MSATYVDHNTGVLMRIDSFGQPSPVPMLTYYIDPDTRQQVIRGVDMEEARFDKLVLMYDLIPQTAPAL